MNEIDLMIDRIVFTDLHLSPGGAEQLRTLIVAELENLLKREGLTPPGADLSVTTRHVALAVSEEPETRQLAGSIARCLVETLGGPY